MSFTNASLKLTQEGAQRLLAAAVAKAVAMGQPQCIAIVDEGCNLLAFLRMDGAKVLSAESATHKAMTAASIRAPTGSVQGETAFKLAWATRGKVTHLNGGLPIIIDGHTLGGIGVGSGTGEQDREVANAALAALPGAQTF